MSNGKSPVPSFVLYINNSRIPPEREAEIKKITITDKVNAPSSFSIHVADPDDEWRSNDNYYIGSKVKILFGYKDDLEEIISGEMTGCRVHYKRNESVNVIMTGQNLLHQLKRFKRIQAFNEMTVKDIITQIADGAGLKADVDALSYEYPFTLQQNMSDFEYLLTLSDRHDCYFYVNDTTLTFKRLIKNSAEDVVLEYGKTLLEFFPKADTTRIVSQVDVLVWNPAKHEAISGTAAFGDIDAKGGEVVDGQFGGAVSVHVDPSALDQKGADQLAIDLLTRNTRDYVTGTGSTYGNTAIRAGSIVKVEGIAEKFNGKYFILAAKHILDPLTGYRTFFAFTTSLGSPVQAGTGAEAAQEESSTTAAAGTEETTEEEQAKNPQITNLKWMKDGEEVNKANVGDTIILTAEVTDIDDGTRVEISIWEKDDVGSDDFIKRFYSSVDKNAVKKEWKVEYHEDTDDIESEEEQEEKGYTLPEYVFKMETTSGQEAESEKSLVLEVIDEIEIRITDELTGEPLANAGYILLFQNGETREGELDEKGYAKETDLMPGKSYHLIIENYELE